MAGKMTSTGIKVGVVASVPATIDAAGFGALSYTDCGELIDAPEYGPTVQVVESLPLATGVVDKYNGFVNNGSTTLAFDLDFSDAGQNILRDGVAIPPNQYVKHSFKIEYPDGTIEYYVAGIFGAPRSPGSANSMVGYSVPLEITSVIINVAAP